MSQNVAHDPEVMGKIIALTDCLYSLKVVVPSAAVPYEPEMAVKHWSPPVSLPT